MGQKVNPHGMRIGINKDWQSKWYSNNKDFSKFLASDLKIRKYLEKKLKMLLFLISILIEIQRKQMSLFTQLNLVL